MPRKTPAFRGLSSSGRWSASMRPRPDAAENPKGLSGFMLRFMLQ